MFLSYPCPKGIARKAGSFDAGRRTVSTGISLCLISAKREKGGISTIGKKESFEYHPPMPRPARRAGSAYRSPSTKDGAMLRKNAKSISRNPAEDSSRNSASIGYAEITIPGEEDAAGGPENANA